MMDKVVIIDLEGVLANNAWRSHLPPDWETYYKASIDDKTYPVTALLVRLLCLSMQIAIVTTTSERYRGIVNEWLNRNLIPGHKLIMRPEDDWSSEVIFKQSVVERIFAGHNIELVLDDNAEVVEMYRKLGLNCHLVTNNVRE